MAIEQCSTMTPDPFISFEHSEHIRKKYRLYQAHHDDRRVWLRLRFSENLEKVYIDAYDGQEKKVIRKYLEYVDTKITKN
jgi:hypothetical protein